MDAVSERRSDDRKSLNSSSAKLLVSGGSTGLISFVEFDGSSFKIGASYKEAGTMASWQLFREGTTQLYAVDEKSNATRLFNIDFQSNEITLVQNAVGSAGVVFLEFNKDRTRMAGAAYEGSSLDFWDVSSPDGTLQLIKTIAVPDDLGPNLERQDRPHPHQILLDPTGRFFVCPDLGTDRIIVVDALGDSFEITSSIKMREPGSGPRHGVFFPPGAEKATHYIVLCELSNFLEVFALDYTDRTINFTPVQRLSTFGEAFPPANAGSAAAGGIEISPDGKDIYVSNRLTGHTTDSLAHFVVAPAQDGSISLAFRDTVNSGGILPRMFSLGLDNFADIIFSTNQQGQLGLAAFKKNPDGSLASQPVASLPLAAFADPNSVNGPQFVQQLSIPSYPEGGR